MKGTDGFASNCIIIEDGISRKRSKNNYLECIACCDGNYAEHIHPVLKVPICGTCKFSCTTRDTFIDGNNEVSCIWCGQSDGSELFMCDSCIFSYCTNCITSNFGAAETNYVRSLKEWSCYVCCESPRLLELQISDKDIDLQSLERIYAQIRPPTYSQDIDRLNLNLSNEEKKFASIFFPQVNTSTLFDVKIIDFLLAGDIYRVASRISKNLQILFRNIVLVPGLFLTPYSAENCCRLFDHQIASLHSMQRIENQSKQFGALRGGIFADEPGLGKTVTVLALVATSAGTYPSKHIEKWNDAALSSDWSSVTQQYQHPRTILPLINKLACRMNSFGIPSHDLLKLSKELCATRPELHDIDYRVKASIKSCSLSTNQKKTLKHFFDFEFNKLKAALDSKQRKSSQARHSRVSRESFERQLYPTCATLIIVPLTLLEHWCEQIMKHLNLLYYSDDATSMEGLVYLDGLGDIAHVQLPIAQLQVKDKAYGDIDSIEKLSTYLIVITTIERCAMESNVLWSENIIEEKQPSQLPLLLQMRWLRLIVDEGHELVTERPKRSLKTPLVQTEVVPEHSGSKLLFQATLFIQYIAAERRWVMSGTPTTGATTEAGLNKLFVLLGFLRHPQFGPASKAGRAKATETWKKEIVAKCIKQDTNAWAVVRGIIQQIMVRHTKEDIELFRPIHRNIALEPFRQHEDLADPDQTAMLADDRAKAKFISDTMLDAMKKFHADKGRVRSSPDKGRLSLAGRSSHTKERLVQDTLRQPKAIVFSQYNSDLQGVGHFLYSMMGDCNICEHFGPYKSSELSRFRHSKRKFRVCTLCGTSNGITEEKHCSQTLYLVEYIDIPPPDNENTIFPPHPGGHGSGGPGGHFLGPCLCSPAGCALMCGEGLPNPFHDVSIVNNPNLALILLEDLQGWYPGLRVVVGQEVYIKHAAEDPNASMLWKGGKLGGRAAVRGWRRCGGVRIAHDCSWHGAKVLKGVPWQIEEEDAMVLLLQRDGSTGLDLSFATHIFLLEKIKDPALRSQIISRAHRVGARGPVEVFLLQVIAGGSEAQGLTKASKK